MKYSAEIGKIYDSLFFCIKFFNEQAVKDTITNDFSDVSFMEECYDEVKKTVPSLPSILKPFFLYQNQTPTVMTSFFKEYIDYQNDTVDTFLSKITSKSDVIYSKILSTLFSSVSDAPQSVNPCVVPAAYIEALHSSEYPEDFKLNISLLFGNFDYVIGVLTEQLRQIFQSVNLLHNKYIKILSAANQQINSERNIQLYDRVLKTDIYRRTDEYYCSISLLNQYIMLYTYTDGCESLLLGLHHEESLNDRINEKIINIRQLLIAVGNDTRLSILQALKERHEMTATEISKKLGTPLTTVLRHIEVLYGSGILFISKRNGLQIFYQMNSRLLSDAFKLLSADRPSQQDL